MRVKVGEGGRDELKMAEEGRMSKLASVARMVWGPSIKDVPKVLWIWTPIPKPALTRAHLLIH